MKINKIFYGIQGEGVHQGLPMVFVRLQGCNLIPHCDYCDTLYAQNPKEGKEMGVEEVVQEVINLNPYRKSWICITGGEPLWQEDTLDNLVRALKQGGYHITVETNGSFKPPRWYTLVDSWNADIKCPSSKVCGISSEMWFKTRQCDQVKFVVGTEEDLIYTQSIIKKHWADSPTILVSPVIILGHSWRGAATSKIHMATLKNSKPWMQRVVQFCLDEHVRFSLQSHKVVFGNKKDV